jgi:hypothetical protein
MAEPGHDLRLEFRRVQLPRTGLERIWTLSVSSLGFTHFTPEARTHDAVYLHQKSAGPLQRSEGC